MQISKLQTPIADVVPHIFRRPALSVSPTDSLLQVGEFLAIGPQIYVDGLVVVEGKNPVGRIGGSHIVQHILEHQNAWIQSSASQIMSNSPAVVEASDPVSVALDIFYKTRFAFLPVTINGTLATSLSIRDVLRVVGTEVAIQVGKISSRLVSVNSKTSVKEALELMLAKGIRNLAIMNDRGRPRVINDRKILEYLLSYEGRRTAARTGGLEDVRIDMIDLQTPKYVKQGTSVRIAANLLSDLGTTCLLLPNDTIVTPWDIVMKGVRG